MIKKKSFNKNLIALELGSSRKGTFKKINLQDEKMEFQQQNIKFSNIYDNDFKNEFLNFENNQEKEIDKNINSYYILTYL